MINIIRRAVKPDPAAVRRLALFGSATIHEAQGRKGALHSSIRPIKDGFNICGPAYTVKGAAGDNLMLQLAISYAEEGDVIVVSAGDYSEAGAFGDLLCTAAQTKNLQALVIDTGVRDVRMLREMGFPVFSKSICIKGTMKEAVGSINHPVTFGGEIIFPGDIIVGDDDGLVVVPQTNIADVVAMAEAREEAESLKRARYLAGETVIDVNGLAAVIKRKGITVD